MKTYKLISDEKIAEVIAQTCRANNCPKLATSITFEWSNHIISKTGQFSLRDDSIKLAAQVLERLNAERQAEAVSRETCHLICWHVYHNTAHEHLWRQCMAKAGYPEATCKQNLPLDGLKRKAYSAKRSPYFFLCSCSNKPYQLNAIIAKHIALDGHEYECSKCKNDIVLVRNDIAEAV